ncbi:unnamed protein product [Symbiodinium sp. CCMP2592]|nr:unnamed protein product [Symbiodinium sp. CCMP2592]
MRTLSTSTPGSRLACSRQGCHHEGKYRYVCRQQECPGRHGHLPDGTPIRAPVTLILCKLHRNGSCPGCRQVMAPSDIAIMTDEICSLTTETSDADIHLDEEHAASFSAKAQDLLLLWQKGSDFEFEANRLCGNLNEMWRKCFDALHLPGIQRVSPMPQQLCEVFVVAWGLSSDVVWVQEACESELVVKVLGLLQQPTALEPFFCGSKRFLPADLGLLVIEGLASNEGCRKQAYDQDVFGRTKSLLFDSQDSTHPTTEERHGLALTALLLVTKFLHEDPSCGQSVKRAEVLDCIISILGRAGRMKVSELFLARVGRPLHLWQDDPASEEHVLVLARFSDPEFLQSPSSDFLALIRKLAADQDFVQKALQPEYKFVRAMLSILGGRGGSEASAAALHCLANTALNLSPHDVYGPGQFDQSKHSCSVVFMKWLARTRWQKFCKELLRGEEHLCRLLHKLKCNSSHMLEHSVLLLAALMFHDESGLLEDKYWDAGLFHKARLALGAVPWMSTAQSASSLGPGISTDYWEQKFQEFK